MDSIVQPGADQRAGLRSWLGLAVLALPTLLLSVDITVLFLALPNLSADLGASGTEQLWIIDIYGFMIAGMLVTMGSLGDRIGRRRLLLIGGTAFGLLSILVAFSTSPEMLIIARALLGIAGATIMPSALALIMNMFPDPKQQGTAIAVFISCFMGGAAVGPVVGGAMLTNFWWGSVFLLNVPIMLLLVITGPILLPESRDPEGGRLDLVSVVLSLAAVLPVIYGLKQLASHGWALVPVLVLAAGIAFGVIFVHRQHTRPDPLLDLKLFKSPAFSGAVAIMTLGSVMMAGVSMFFTLFLQLVKGYNPLQAGLWMVISAVTMVLGSMIAPRLTQRLRPAVVLAGGLTISAAGFFMLTTIGADTGIAVPIIGVAVVSTGAGIFATLTTGLVMTAAPPEKAGAAAGLSETGGELGVALGIAVIGSVGTAVYTALLVVPDGVPTQVADTARENITGAATASHGLPADLGAALLGNAQTAFTSALNAVSGVSAGVAILLIAVALVALRKAPPTGAATPEPAATETPEKATTSVTAE
ncbi:MFS transporter [Amycolatopsis sp.]|jgi:DHA2 family multidrug resistance protein-like MFS transporter|uniref:MFS transporter n=1 Tax=Amycolatopsis sp. TaxID=37632 RepID=UPI002DFCB730|nr:MFS transporter [Amycolatopsis sp.]